jgi:hypothetical protein
MSGHPTGAGPTAPAADHPYAAELDAEREGWYEFFAIVHTLTLDECQVHGYYLDPDWSVRDLVAHIGTWLAEGEIQLERIGAGTYEGHDIDIDALNDALLTAMRDQPWSVAWVQANAARTRMIQEWFGLRARSDEAAWWIRKAGSEHYAEHLGRLREWANELYGRRPSTPQADERMEVQ